MKTIVIVGFPHCGTTILKNKLGDCSNATEIVDEFGYDRDIPEITKDVKTEFAIVKSVQNRLNAAKLVEQGHIPIIIIRSPYFVFASLKRRFPKITYINNPDRDTVRRTRNKSVFMPLGHQFNDYENLCLQFIDCIDSKIPGAYAVRYEDLFKGGLEFLMKNIGLTPPENISKRNRDYQVVSRFGLKDILDEDDATTEEDHGAFRTVQINKPFRLMNDPEKLKDLPDRWARIINNSQAVHRCGY